MTGPSRDYDVIIDFWEWYRRRQERQSGPLANYALDKCEEAFGRCEWTNFGRWHAIYLRERRKAFERKTNPRRQID
jgi:hypothetical protein